MLQIFLQPSKISVSEWQAAYRNIKTIVENFPTKIIRLESYKRYEGKFDKLHFNLILEAGTPNEHISFWGDWMSYTGRLTIRFYKDWSKQQELQSYGKEIDEHKPITWHPNIPYKNDGAIPLSNGILPFSYSLADTEGAHYESVLIAIGIMLEDLFPGSAFLTVLWGENHKEIEAVLNWLEVHFDKPFSKPLYFDKIRLLKSLRAGCANDKNVICRLAHLYRQKHKKNMEFAIKNIGYEPTFEFYSEVLADTGFGTFGFEDVLDPWIAVSQDLTSTLNLITASKNLLLQNPDNKDNIEKAGKYNYAYILKKLLNNFILWTPLQREKLEHLYSNKQALEEGREGLFGIIRRMAGYRLDICPFYANKEELFEAFMYHDPKNGKIYKTIVDDWVEKNINKYEELKKQIELTLKKQEQKEAELPFEEIAAIEVSNEAISNENFVNRFLPHERHFVRKAITSNPLFPRVDEAIKTFKERVIKAIENHSDKEYLDRVKNLPKETHLNFIKSRIRAVWYCVHPNFETQLEEVNDENILFYLHITMAMKLYDPKAHFSRFRLLWDSSYWENWTT